MNKELKYIKFEILMEELKYFEYDENLPIRNDPKYVGSDILKGIEQIELFEFNPSIMFEMAIRNKEVIEIIEKIEYIYKLMTEFLSLEKKQINDKSTNKVKNSKKEKRVFCENNQIFTKEIEVEELYPEIYMEEKLIELTNLEIFNFYHLHRMIIPFELQKEYNRISLLSIDKFIKELDFLMDSKYDDKIEESFNHNNKLANKTTKYCYELSEIMELLQQKLKNKYYIYPNGYLKGTKLTFTQKTISRNVFFNEIFNNKEINQKINEMIVEYRKLKPVDIKSVADLFFMYDYSKKRVENEDTNLINQDIKFALTKHHGIQIKGQKNLLSYHECLERYEEFKDKEAGFYIVERSIRDKLDIMKKFIDSINYCYIVFA